jgi:hypothetical protein
MSKVRGRAESHKNIGQASRPDARFLRKGAFGKSTLPEQPMAERPRAYISGRSPLRAFYYTKTARGRWHTADRVTRGTKWNAYLCSGTAIPKGTMPEIFKAPPAVSGILFSIRARGERNRAAEQTNRQGHRPARASHVLAPQSRTTHSRSSLDTGWLDVPMPGALTQFQQGASRHSDASRPHTPRVAPRMPAHQAPTAISMQAGPANTANAQPKRQDIQQREENARPIMANEERLPEGSPRQIHAPQTRETAARANEDVSAHAPAPRSEPARLLFNSVHAQVKAKKPRAETRAPASSNAANNPKPNIFHAESPRSEQLLRAPEIKLHADAARVQFKAEQIRVDGIQMPAHIGYIPSVRKKERQLKVAQGAEGIPPQ